MKLILSALTFLIVLASCAPLPGLQSGRSLGKGNGVITPYVQAGDLYLRRDDSEQVPALLPTAGAQFSTGVTDRLDLGGRVDISTFLSFQAKYQVLGNQNSKFAVGLGGEAGVTVPALAVGGVFYYYAFPLFISYHPKENLTFHLMPLYSVGTRYVVKNANGNGRDAFSNSRNQSGFSYGFSVGKKNKLVFEISHYSSQLYQPTRAAVGYTFFFLK